MLKTVDDRVMTALIIGNWPGVMFCFQLERGWISDKLNPVVSNKENAHISTKYSF